ncbi:hypothetical protein IWW55_005543, partial [Coemansia sp. RSA 2706]
MSVIVPDRPAPLSSAPAAMAHRHDRRRDYFTDSTTLKAAMGKAAPRNTGMRYDLREHSSAERTEIELVTSNRTASPVIHHVDKDGGLDAKRFRRISEQTPGAESASLPLFKRAGSLALPHTAQRGDYGRTSHLPRFMREHTRSTDSFASDGSSDSGVQSPRSTSSLPAMQSMLELEEARLLEAERKSQLQAVDSILSEEQKIAYVGLVYLILVDMQNRLNVQYRESQSSTASFMNFSRRLMRKMYAHICLSCEEQRMVELLPRHKVTIPDMARSLAAQGDTILVEADRDLAVMQTDDELVSALRRSSDCRSSAESTRDTGRSWFRSKKTSAGSENDIYAQYAMLSSEGGEPELETKLDATAGSPLPKSSTPSDTDDASSDFESRAITSRAASVADIWQNHGRDFPASNTCESPNDRSLTAPLPSTEASSVNIPHVQALVEDDSGDALDDAALIKVEAEQTLTIDVRATLVLDL